MPEPRRVPIPENGTARAERRAESRRLEILRAAARVFRERGFAEAGMREIAAAAGVSLGILYHYFAGKNEILYFCQDRALDRMLSTAKAARGRKSPAADRLRDVLRAHVLCLLDDVEGSVAHLETGSYPANLRSKILAKRDVYEGEIRELIALGAVKGSFHAPDPTLLTRAILGAVNWTARWYRPGGCASPEDVASAVADFLVAGLEQPASRTARVKSNGSAHELRRTNR
jgi:AcrR family transcriptional regulator